MTPVELSRTVLRAVRRAVDAGELDVAVPARAVVTVPGPGGCGDYATNVALQLARPAGQPPLRVAELLRPHLAEADGVADVVLTGPGFLNISLHRAAPAGLVEEILRRGLRYGHADGPDGRVVRLHCAHDPRALVVADATARILRSQGAVVRTSCAAPPAPEWADVLGVHVDAAGPAPVGLPVGVRPVPASGDPLPLGRDAGRWALLHPAPHDRPRLGDENLAQRESNPLFRVRYAHARTRALRRNAAALGFAAEPGPLADVAAEPGLLTGAAAAPAPGATPADRPHAPGGNTAEPGPTAEPAPLPAVPGLRAAPADQPRALGHNAPAPGRTPAGPAPAAEPGPLTGMAAAPADHPGVSGRIAPALGASAPALGPVASKPRSVAAPGRTPTEPAPAAEPGPLTGVPATPAGHPAAPGHNAPAPGTAVTKPGPAAHGHNAPGPAAHGHNAPGAVATKPAPAPGRTSAPATPPEPAPPTPPEAHALLPLLADHPRVLAAAAEQRAPDRLARHLVAVADATLPLLPTVLPRGAEKPSAAHRARLALAEAAGTVLAGGLTLLGIDAPDHL